MDRVILNETSLRRPRFADDAKRHLRAVHALLLRDIQTRVGASYLGFFVSLLFPLAHIAILLIIYIGIGRKAPIGTDVTLYLASAIVPFIVWSYSHQKVMLAFQQNKALTAFPAVKLIDIFVARALVEAINSGLIVASVAAALFAFGVDLFISAPPQVFLALVMAYLLGISTGLTFGMLSLAMPSAAIAGFLMIPLYWITCGNFFIPDALPERLRQAVAVFPVAHIVDYTRINLYPSYLSDFSSLTYVALVAAGNLLLGLLAERLFINSLLSK